MHCRGALCRQLAPTSRPLHAARRGGAPPRRAAQAPPALAAPSVTCWRTRPTPRARSAPPRSRATTGAEPGRRRGRRQRRAPHRRARAPRPATRVARRGAAAAGRPARARRRPWLRRRQGSHCRAGLGISACRREAVHAFGLCCTKRPHHGDAPLNAFRARCCSRAPGRVVTADSPNTACRHADLQRRALFLLVQASEAITESSQRRHQAARRSLLQKFPLCGAAEGSDVSAMFSLCGAAEGGGDAQRLPVRQLQLQCMHQVERVAGALRPQRGRAPAAARLPRLADAWAGAACRPCAAGANSRAAAGACGSLGAGRPEGGHACLGSTGLGRTARAVDKEGGRAAAARRWWARRRGPLSLRPGTRARRAPRARPAARRPAAPRRRPPAGCAPALPCARAPAFATAVR